MTITVLPVRDDEPREGGEGEAPKEEELPPRRRRKLGAPTQRKRDLYVKGDGSLAGLSPSDVDLSNVIRRKLV